ncbi:hypothetical protein DH2020_043006 [Rehmannia glutinosa]|uniref:Polygalacturonase n=1 Tax=Rehmannia glutinosa TaxID=99300 RepID=A0ABR0UKU5_REHGL
MGSDLLTFFVLFILSLSIVTKSDDDTIFNVVDYGAVGNGQIDDTNAFVKAWQETCASSSSSPVMKVPSDKTFLIRPLQFRGPCNSNSLTVEINGNLVAHSDPWKWECEDDGCQKWIYFHRVDGLKLRGHGTIDGRGQNWWNKQVLEISNANNVYLEGLKFKDSPRMHVVLNGLTSISVENITIDAPEKSPNTDGIHVSGCTNAVIDRSQIRTGDDCISIVDGSSFVKISNIICGPGHGISIGSLGKNGAYDKVEYVRVSDVVFTGATNGARIKTWQESAVQITNVTYRQFLGTSRGKTAVKLNCSKTKRAKISSFMTYTLSRWTTGTRRMSAAMYEGESKEMRFLKCYALNKM